MMSIQSPDEGSLRTCAPAGRRPSEEAGAMVARLGGLRECILAGDNAHCFIERQQVLHELAPRIASVPEEERYAFILEQLLARVSTPIERGDVLLGRMKEGPLPAGQEYVRNLPGFASSGHCTLDWPALLSKGLDRIASEARATAQRLRTDEAHRFAANATRCCEAIVAYARRYASAARDAAEAAEEPDRAFLLRAADALEVAPPGPAPDFFSALQAIWIVHLVTCCCIGARDFAFGRMDQYLLPLYRRGIEAGTLTRESAVAVLAHFMLKTKEITGTHTDNYRPKPTPCHASNQYLVLGGTSADGSDDANEVSLMILEAIRLARVPQPEINVRVGSKIPDALKGAIAAALPTCHSQIQFWNDERVISTLKRWHIEGPEAHGYTLTACNRIDLPGVFDFQAGDAFHNMAHWLLIALGGGRDPASGGQVVSGIEPAGSLQSMGDVLEMLRRACVHFIHAAVMERARWMRGGEKTFHFESVLFRGCVERGRDYSRGGTPRRAQYHFFGGVATVANSLMAIQRLVLDQKRYSLPELLAVVARNFEGEEALRLEIVNGLPKYGNDDEGVDSLARSVCEIAADALASAPNPDGFLLFPSVYSLHAHFGWGKGMPATPDGRRAGEPVSENQSPTHGTDREGVTALLKSVARLPMHRTPMGGLNIRVGFRPAPETIFDLMQTFFRLGGVHVGYTIVDRDTLLAAQAHPETYRTLCVRITGYSEYFVSLSPDGQRDIIDRTEY